MRKRVIIVHGWDAVPSDGWHFWLKRELEKHDFEVLVPQMPETEEPKIGAWVPALSKVIGEADEDTYLVGHSMGCQTIIRYLEALEGDTEIGGAVFVAGFLTSLTGLEGPEIEEIAKPWMETPINLAAVRDRLGNSVAIFSDNDTYVPLENQAAFRDQLGSKIVVMNSMDHFSGNEGFDELPIALESVLKISES